MDKKQFAAVLVAVLVTLIVLSLATWRQQEYERRRRAWEAEHPEPQAPQAPPQPEPAELVEPGPSAPAQPEDQEPTEAPEPDEAPALQTAAEPARVRNIAVRGPEFEATFTSRGAALRDYTLVNFHRTPVREQDSGLRLLDTVRPGETSLRLLDLSDGVDLRGRNWDVVEDTTAEPRSERRLVFRTVVSGWRITKTYVFGPREGPVDNPVFAYGFQFEVALENLADRSRNLAWRMTALAGPLPDDADARFGRLKALLATYQGQAQGAVIEREALSGFRDEPWTFTAGNLAWMAFKGRFFTALVRVEEPRISGRAVVEHLDIGPQADEQGYFAQADARLQKILRSQPDSGRILYKTLTHRDVEPGASQAVRFVFYGGPVTEQALAFDPALQDLPRYSFFSWFEPISKILVRILNFLYPYLHNYGLVIIVLTLLLKTAMHGLTRKALAAGHKMQKLQPLMKEVRERYKDDKAKQQEEIMRMWREHGVSPWGSCLPMFVQIPVFIALYGAFANAFSMRQATFIPGWITDLSQPDALFSLPFVVPIVGWETLNLLPILYVVITLVQQAMTPKSKDPQVQQQQRMMKLMPVLFMFIFYSMPSGLVLYFTVSAGYTLVEHWFIRRRLEGADARERAQAAGPAAAGTGFARKGNKSASGQSRKRRRR